MKRLSSIVSTLSVQLPSGLFSAKFRDDLASIATGAYKWNRNVKSTFKALDFRPILFTDTDRFDPASMILYLNHKPNEVPPRNVVVAVALALLSVSSVDSGDTIKEEYVWQTKADVVTAGFF